MNFGTAFLFWVVLPVAMYASILAYDEWRGPR